METTHATQPLTSELIRNLLTQEAQSQMSPAYVRLIEIYCVVKIGGVAMQMEVARKLEETEKTALLKDIQALSAQSGTESRIHALRQEIQELERSVANRLGYLSTIAPQEEAQVRDCLSEIDSYFKSLETIRR